MRSKNRQNKRSPHIPYHSLILLGFFLYFSWLGFFSDSSRILLGFFLDSPWVLLAFFLDSSWIILGFFLDSCVSHRRHGAFFHSSLANTIENSKGTIWRSWLVVTGMADWSPTMAKLASRNWHGRLVLCRFGYVMFFFSKIGAQFLKRSSAKRSAWEDTGRGGKRRDGKVRERERKGR